MRKLWLGAILVVVVAAVAAALWSNRTGTFSYANYERILPGMSLGEVEDLLGSAGTDIPATELPGVVDWSEPVDSPKRVKAVVSGERFVRWGQRFDTCIFISFQGEKVKEKFYMSYSL